MSSSEVTGTVFWKLSGTIRRCPLVTVGVRIVPAGWRPPGVVLPENLLADAEGVAAMIRVTGGTFRRPMGPDTIQGYLSFSMEEIQFSKDEI